MHLYCFIIVRYISHTVEVRNLRSLSFTSGSIVIRAFSVCGNVEGRKVQKFTFICGILCFFFFLEKVAPLWVYTEKMQFLFENSSDKRKGKTLTR